MKKLGIVVMMIGLMVAGNVIAQDTPPPPPEKVKLTPKEKAERRTEKMRQELDLSDAQAEKIKELSEKHFQEMESLHQRIKALKEEGKSMREAHKAEISEVLTPEQRELHEQKVEERKRKKDACKKKCSQR